MVLKCLLRISHRKGTPSEPQYPSFSWLKSVEGIGFILNPLNRKSLSKVIYEEDWAQSIQESFNTGEFSWSEERKVAGFFCTITKNCRLSIPYKRTYAYKLLSRAKVSSVTS
jgi:hypothetical protein